MLLRLFSVFFALALSGCDSCSNPKETSKPPSSTSGPASGLAKSAIAASASAVSVSIAPPGAASLAPMPPGALTKFFPKDGAGGYKRVPAGEREGYAEAKLQKDGKEVAILSITDAERLAYMKAKFDGVTEKVGDFPVVKTDDTQTSVLVRDRFQVKVMSNMLDHEARKAILAMFDLAGLGA
jgi:hypothetical protein